MTRQTPNPIEPAHLDATNRGARELARLAEQGIIDVNTPYQRGDVWTLDQRIGLIRSWLTGVPIPAVILNNRHDVAWASPLGPDDPMYAVIDGKQRILTAIAWFQGDFAVPASWFPTDQVEHAEDTAAGPYVPFPGLTKIGQRRMRNNTAFACVEARLANTRREAEVYLLVNGAGTAQTTADLDNARAITDQH